MCFQREHQNKKGGCPPVMCRSSDSSFSGLCVCLWVAMKAPRVCQLHGHQRGASRRLYEYGIANTEDGRGVHAMESHPAIERSRLCADTRDEQHRDQGHRRCVEQKQLVSRGGPFTWHSWKDKTTAMGSRWRDARRWRWKKVLALIIKTIKTGNQRGSAHWLQPGQPPSMEQGFAGRWLWPLEAFLMS